MYLSVVSPFGVRISRADQRTRKEGQAILKAQFDRVPQVIDSLNVVKSINVSMRMNFLLSLFTIQPRYSFSKFCLRRLKFRMEAGGIHISQAYSSFPQVSGISQTTSEPKGFGNFSRCCAFSVKDICHDVMLLTRHSPRPRGITRLIVISIPSPLCSMLDAKNE
jgi:hypothetical protein